uniref:LAGLIDADG endonuclease n=3 Tax=Fusarium culmorum TaxID=5516 RepID=A0A6G6B4F5_FUSCU|nr:LAGLIDADG endonuclease [Fusarium culmorum]CDL73555.1 Group I intron-encoded double motif LAGLIDADG homing endonuclease n2 TaxOphiostoma minus RepIDG3DRG9_9PEZI [Fusarium culmorum CS7071]QID42353.1 LAGLIDADG endonuclease [Fusarium culmorum]QID42412.1 LAGLIDADG endonuclease [Fusarium culmorum]QID42469.1 LAGLIDADG endonuclease [Fusarium culmorum]
MIFENLSFKGYKWLRVSLFKIKSHSFINIFNFQCRALIYKIVNIIHYVFTTYNDHSVAYYNLFTLPLLSTKVNSSKQDLFIRKNGISFFRRYFSNTPSINFSLSDRASRSNFKLNPFWVAGFVDGEGCFSVIISKSNSLKVGWRVRVYFYIGLHVKDRALLESIQNFFGVGNIYSATESLVRYQVNSFKDIKVIIDFFDKYKLITNKGADFFLFKEVYTLMLNKEHLTLQGLHKIVAIHAAINWGLTDQLKAAFPDIVPVLRPKVQFLNIPDPYWLAGFASGEGCFFINITKSNTYRSGFQIQLKFQLVQHLKDETLMVGIREYLDCGSTYKTRDCFSYQVTKIGDIDDKILPFFTKFPVLGVKAKDFVDFSRVLVLMKDNKLSLAMPGSDKLEQIKRIKSGMNKGRE